MEKTHTNVLVSAVPTSQFLDLGSKGTIVDILFVFFNFTKLWVLQILSNIPVLAYWY